MKTTDISRTGLLIALAMIFSYVESRIPAFIAVPGIKMGLANIVVVFSLYKLGLRNAVFVSILRVLLAALLFGSVLSLAYSTSGAVLSLLTMAFLKKTNVFGTVAVSVAGAVVHNLAQIGVACLVLGTNVIVYYLPVLIITGTISGIVIGLVGAIVIKRVNLNIVDSKVQ